MDNIAFLKTVKNNYEVNQPIFIDELLKLFSPISRAQVFRYINRAKTSNELIQYDTGVYYLPAQTILGRSTISPDAVVRKKYLTNGNKVYGIYAGIKLLNMFGVTTQMAGIVEIVSNKESSKCREVVIFNRKFVVKKSRCKISSENYKTYMILELFNEMGVDEVIPSRAKKIISNYLQEENISAYSLFKMSRFFPAKALKNVIRSEVIDVFF